MRRLRVACNNVNHTPNQSHFLLESMVRTCDILFVQEPYYGPIKRVASNSDPAGDVLVGTQVHPAWILMETRTPARVCAYVNRELNELRPQLCSHVVDHRDMILISLTIDKQVHYLLNVYNDEHSTALTWLQEHAGELPPLDLVVGDFNLHSTMWEPDAPHESPRALDLVNLMSGIGLGLVNADGAPTHRPHNAALRSTVPDLIWAPTDRIASDGLRVRVDLTGRGASDHAILSTTLRVGWWQKTLPPSIKRKSDAEKAFLRDLVDSVARVPVDVDSIIGVQRTCDAIMEAVQAAWDAHATSPRITSRSRHWWSDRCKAALSALKARRTREARRAFLSAVKSAKLQHYDDRIDAACER
ncbi:Endonuclease/exonuclease/phosphatase, partial [Cerioporus squamosus]